MPSSLAYWSTTQTNQPPRSAGLFKMPMSDLLSSNPVAGSWADDAIRRHSDGIFGKIVAAVIWSDARDADGEPLVPVDPLDLAASINRTRLILLNNHDPGRPIGQVLECAEFEGAEGNRFVAAVLGYYAGGRTLTFREVGLQVAKDFSPPEALPTLPENIWIELATDQREIDRSWVDALTSEPPLRIVRTKLSHNAAEAHQELIRVGVVFLTLVWNPFVTAIASEAGKATYAAVFGWFRKLLSRLADRRNPILDIQASQAGCQVSFLFRGKDIDLHYAAHDALASAATQAARLIAHLKARGMPAERLVYEFNKEARKWHPSYAVLEDGRIITDSVQLIAIEQLPRGLSLGLKAQ